MGTTAPHYNLAFYQGAQYLPWNSDTAASHHISPDLASLNIANDYTGGDHLRVGNGQDM